MPGRLSKINSHIYPLLVWLLRVAVGATFIFSGFVKVVDPWGFVFKIQDYLDVWGIHWLWRQAVFCIAAAISLFEFVSGVLLLTGCLRRGVCRLLMLMMVFMLPLTGYIAIAHPVADCGCFGDALVISNTATLIKNIIITAALIYLLKYNHRVASLYTPLIQWMVIAASMFYCVIVAIIGFNVQPLVDFRPYKIGSTLVDEDARSLKVLYAKDGEQREFDVEELPDSTWTYVGRVKTTESDVKHFAVFEDGEEVTADVISSDAPQLLLVVTDPAAHGKARAGMANSLNSYIHNHGGSMIGIVATLPDSLDSWREQTHPQYDVYTADDTALKELTRGDAALVYLVDGKIKWKRAIYSLAGDFPDFETGDNELDNVKVVDDGYLIKHITLIYLSVLAFVYVLGLFRVRQQKIKEAKPEIKENKPADTPQ